MVKSKQYVRGVKPRGVLLESTNLREVEEELATGAILENEEEFAVTLEGVVHLHDEWMADIFLYSKISMRIKYSTLWRGIKIVWCS